MLRYGILCYVILRYVILRYVALCYVILRYVILRYAITLRYVVLRYVILRYGHCVTLLHYVPFVSLLTRAFCSVISANLSPCHTCAILHSSTLGS